MGDVLLQEDGAAVVEGRSPLRAKGRIGILSDVVAEAGGGALKEVAVAGGALGVKLEVLDLAPLHNDDLDVLTAHVGDDVHIGIVAQGRLGMGHCLRYGHIGAQSLLEDVLGIAGGAHPTDTQASALALHLLLQPP